MVRNSVRMTRRAQGQLVAVIGYGVRARFTFERNMPNGKIKVFDKDRGEFKEFARWRVRAPRL